MFKNKDGQVRSGWKIILVMVCAFVLIGISGGILSIIIGIGMLQGQTDVNEITKNLMENKVFMFSSMMLQELFFIAVPIVAWKLFEKKKLREMGLPSIRKHTKEFLVGLCMGFLAFSLVFGLLIITKNAKVTSTGLYFGKGLILDLILFIAVGFAEEILGRGYIMSVLRQTKSKFLVLTISSIIFALLHGSNSGFGMLPFINLMLVGLMLGYIYIKSGNIWMCIGFHITWNYTQGNIYGLSVSGMDINGIISTQINGSKFITGGLFGPEGGILVTIAIISCIVFVKWFYRYSQTELVINKSMEKPMGLNPGESEDALLSE